MPRARTLGLVAAIVPAVLLALVIGGWALDTTVHAGQTMRNVELEGHAVGGLADAELFDALAQVDEDLADAVVTVKTPAGDLESTAGEVGLVLDQTATRLTLRNVGRDGAMASRPARWLGSMLDPLEGHADFTISSGTLAAAMEQIVAENKQEPVEPSIELVDGELAAVPGVAGATLDLAELARRLEAAAETGGLPVTVEVGLVEVLPDLDDEVAVQLASEANALTAEPLVVRIGDETREVTTGQQRTWLASELTGERLVLSPIDDAIETDLEELFGDLEAMPTPATFDIDRSGEAPVPVVLDGTAGQRCCAEDAASIVFDALIADEHEVAVGLGEVQHENDRAWAEGLGIKELVGSFTTNHGCCEGRVQNIHRIADLTRGVIIPPGEVFSVNDFVGRRTTANGFVSAGVIKNGVFDEDVGGGISQYATTLFNAAFFAGLDFDAYQSHSIYISRYPYGREATLSFPAPDLQVRNSTEHAVLLWPTYTDTSITIELYSTKTVVGEQTGQSEAPSGRCTRVTTERTRTWVADGRTEVDTVHAVYRPAEGVNC